MSDSFPLLASYQNSEWFTIIVQGSQLGFLGVVFSYLFKLVDLNTVDVS